MERVTALASDELRSSPGVRDVGAHVGRAILGDQAVGANAGELWVSIDPGADYDATVASVKRVVAAIQGFSRTVQTYSQDRVTEALTGTKQDVVVRVYGEDLDTLRTQAAKVRRALSGVDGVAQARVLLRPRSRRSRSGWISPRRTSTASSRVTVRRAATTLLSGLVVGSLFEQQKVFDVVVWGVPSVRANLTSIRQLLIDTPGGGQVRLGDVAAVRIAASPGIIKRQDVSRYVDVGASVSGRDRDAVVRDVQGSLQSLRFPIEYHAEILAADTQPTWRLISIAIAAVVGMLLLLQVLLGSWRLATFAMLTLPLAVLGAPAAVLAAGGKLSFGSYIGLFAVFGLAARAGLLLFDRIRQLETDEGEEFGAGVIMRAARERLVPVAMTATTAGLLSVAVLILGSRPGLELLHPIAVVFVGGLITTVAVNVLVLPVLYARFGLSRAAERETAREPGGLTAVLDKLARGGDAGGAAAPPPRRSPPSPSRRHAPSRRWNGDRSKPPARDDARAARDPAARNGLRRHARRGGECRVGRHEAGARDGHRPRRAERRCSGAARSQDGGRPERPDVQPRRDPLRGRALRPGRQHLDVREPGASRVPAERHLCRSDPGRRRGSQQRAARRHRRGDRRCDRDLGGRVRRDRRGLGRVEMMRWIVGSSLKFRYVLVAAGAALLVFGAQQLRAMPVDAFPEFAPPRVEVQTLCLGLTAKEVEELVSTPLEQSLTGVPGLDLIRSKSVPQLSSVELLFKPGPICCTCGSSSRSA
jgi:Cu/Ag efflux pump CusA